MNTQEVGTGYSSNFALAMAGLIQGGIPAASAQEPAYQEATKQGEESLRNWHISPGRSEEGIAFLERVRSTLLATDPERFPTEPMNCVQPDAGSSLDKPFGHCPQAVRVSLNVHYGEIDESAVQPLAQRVAKTVYTCLNRRGVILTVDASTSGDPTRIIVGRTTGLVAQHLRIPDENQRLVCLT